VYKKQVLDGWGYRPETEGNAIALANTPTWDSLWRRGSRTLLEASGLRVGLPEGQMGNSEVGHTNLGARLFNVSSMLSNLVCTPDGKHVALHLVNYTDFPVESITAHVLGTARMGEDPRVSVTDAHGRVHDVPNVVVADGSVFASSGGANPTLTIVALALRQADHIEKSEEERGKSPEEAKSIAYATVNKQKSH